MKKKVMIFFALIVGTIASAQNLRESIAIVRPNFSESTQTFLTDFSKSLRKDGFYAAADILQNYGKGSFGTGFAYRDKRDGRLYIITNRHVVEQAETVDVEFSLPDNSSKTFATCPVVGVHDDFDVAFIALPEEANIPIIHQVIYEFRNLLIIKYWIRKDHTFFWFCFSHFFLKIMFLFGAALFPFTSTLPLKHLLNLYSLFQQTKT